jgi:hypothetical protein
LCKHKRHETGEKSHAATGLFTSIKALNDKRIYGQKGNRLFSSANGLNNKPLSGQKGNLLLPGALLVTMQAQLLAPFMSVDFGLPAFFQ